MNNEQKKKTDIDFDNNKKLLKYYEWKSSPVRRDDTQNTRISNNILKKNLGR